MGFKCGIVGLPNVGKSTIFNALTAAGAESANYPFCTIDPNIGMVAVPDERLGALAELVRPQQVIPTSLEFVDIAGLVRGASRGEGLGNQFLGHIRQVDAIAHIVRCFEDDNVVHVDGSVDPVRDVEVIQTELNLADLETVQKRLTRIGKQARSGDKELQFQLVVLERVSEALNQGDPVRSLELSDEERKVLAELHLITAKPILYVANVGEADLGGEHPLVERLRELAARDRAEVVVICGRIEEEISELEEAEKADFLRDLGFEESGLDRMIRAGYRLLGLITFFTAGPKEVRAWTAPGGARAPQAAGVIHTDFERGFIRAEVIGYDDFVNAGSESRAKERGLMRLEGKEYLVQDGDVVHFRFKV